MSTTSLRQATDRVLWFRDITMADLPVVGRKNASLGEMIGTLSQAGVRVPEWYATTADAFRDFLRHGDLDRRGHPRAGTVGPLRLRGMAAGAWHPVDVAQSRCGRFDVDSARGARAADAGR